MICLADGYDIPQVGLAAFCNDSILDTISIIKESFSVGIRHYEIVELFGNGHIIVDTLYECLNEYNLSRDDIYITIKVWPKDKKSNEIVESGKSLFISYNLEYVDLLLVHAPIDIDNYYDQWLGLEQLKDENLVRSIGVANITAVQLQDLLKNCVLIPSVFQVEVTPFSQKISLCEFISDSSILVLNNEPTVKNMKSNNHALQQIAKELNISTDVLLIRWSITKGYATLLRIHGSPLQCGSIKDYLQVLPSEIATELDLLEEKLDTTWHAVWPSDD